jgi:alpha-galactosidase
MSKIVIIGLGSAFGRALVGDLFSFPMHLRDSEIWLVDTNVETLERVGRYAGRINQSVGEIFDIRITDDRAEALPDADFVVLGAAIDRIATWRQDWLIPLKHGVRHVLGENGGPGGLSHTLRMVPLVVEIARDVERLAPHALLMVQSNPISRLCMAIARHTRVRVVGLARGYDDGYRLINSALNLVKPDARGDEEAQLRNIKRRIRVGAGGIDRLSFAFSVEDALRGRDLYPELRERLRALRPDQALLTRRLCDVFGVLCMNSEAHVGEFLGFGAETQGLAGFDFDAHLRQAAADNAAMDAVIDGQIAPAYTVVRTSGYRAIPLLATHANDVAFGDAAVNVPNDGLITGLAADAIVCVPASIDPGGIRGVPIPPLPEGLLALLRREVDISRLAVEAALSGDRATALQALLLDPHVHSYAQATHLLDDLLLAQRAHLPRFA